MVSQIYEVWATFSVVIRTLDSRLGILGSRYVSATSMLVIIQVMFI